MSLLTGVRGGLLALGAFLVVTGVAVPAMATDLEDAVESADADAGAATFRRCGTCHTVDAGGANRVGPNLWGVVGRQIGSHEGFRYSRALAGSEETWTLENLNAFIENPRAARPGTNMSFPGLRGEEDRLNVLAYLSTLGATDDDDSDDESNDDE